MTARAKIVIVILAGLAGGCAQRDYAQCSSGLLCPAPKTCAEPLGLCVPEPWFTACEGKPEGAGCSLRPAQASLNAVLAFSGTSALAVGDAGTILQFEGGEWTAIESGVTGQFNSLWGTDRANVFAVGDAGLAAHFDGVTWTPMTIDTAGNLEGVSGAGSDVYAVGEDYIGKFDGAQFTRVTTGLTVNASDVWVGAADAVFVATDAGDVVRFDGTWQALATGIVGELGAIWGLSAMDVFVTGAGGEIARYDGTAWNMMMSGTQAPVEDIRGRDATSVFAIGSAGLLLHYDGVGVDWLPLESGTTSNLNAITIVGNEGFAVGEGGVILDGDDLAWSSAALDGRCAYRVCLEHTP